MSLTLFKKTGCLLPALLLTAFAGFAQTNYYVSPSGNDANSGLVGFPKKTINGAITTASANDTVNVAAGTYSENVVINKALALKGANYNVSCTGNRGAESIVSGVGGSTLSAITVDANGITVNGFSATHPNGSYGILITGRSNINIQYDVVTNVGNNVSGFSSSFGIFDQIITAAGNNSTNVTISNNCVSNIRGGANTTLTGAAARSNNGSSGGIGLGDSQGQSDVSGVSINGNTIDNITASTNPTVDGGKGVYGVFIDLGAAVTALGKAVNPRVTNNVITNLEGLWAHGVGLEGETPGAVVLNNYLNHFTDHIGGDATGVFVQDNAGSASVQIHENSFTNMLLGVVNATNDSVNATCNWYGSANATIVASRVVGKVVYTPWTTNGTDNAPAIIGFQPVPGTCNGSGGAPTIVCPPNKTIACGASTLPANTGRAVATSSCGPTAVTYTDSLPAAGCRCNYSFVRTWIATDSCGGKSSCTQTITVSGAPLSCMVVITPSNSIYTGGIPTNLYLGYGPQRATLSVSLSFGSGSTYLWTGPTAYLSCTTCASPVFKPTKAGIYMFSVMVTNNLGCSTTCDVRFCVKDIRVTDKHDDGDGGDNDHHDGNNHDNDHHDNNNNEGDDDDDDHHDGSDQSKVYLCHKPEHASAYTISISVSAVAAHLANHNGDKLGQCTQTCGSSARLVLEPESALAADVTVYPNPNNGTFVVQLPDDETQSVILVTDIQGKVITKRTVTDKDGSKINLNLRDAARGVYFLEVISGDQRFRTKLLVQ